jgi:hypothetical protein
MVHIPFTFTIDPWAWFGPMLQAFLITTHHPGQKPWPTTHTNYKYHTKPSEALAPTSTTRKGSATLAASLGAL